MLKKLKKSLILACSITLLLPTMSNAERNVSRISGSDRYETALKVQQLYKNRSTSKIAVVSTGENFKFALYGSYLANSLKVPFYIAPNDDKAKYIIEEVKNKNINKVFIVGDFKNLNNSIDSALKSDGINVERLYERYEGDYLLSIDFLVDTPIFKTFYGEKSRGDISDVILINDNKFPDLLSSIPFVSTLIREQATFLSGINDIEKNIGSEYDGYRFIIGGGNSVSSKIGTYPNDKLGLNLHTDFGSFFYTGRIAGQDRYRTAIEIAKAYKPVLDKNINTIVLVDGTNYPDALSSGTVATSTNGAILLTEPRKLNEHTKKYILEKNIKNIIIVGGEKSVSKDIENELKRL